MGLKSLSTLVIALMVLSCVKAACRDEPDGTFLPDPSSRQRFIYCWAGMEISGQCEPGLEFDPFDRVCDVPRGPTRDPCLGQRDGTFLPDPNSRQGFLWCSGGSSIQGSCNQGDEFNPIELICERPAVNPPVQRDPCWGKADGTFLPDPNSRQGFLWCSGGTGIHGSCDPGFEFHPTERVCERPIVGPPTPTAQPPVQRDPCLGKTDGTFLADPASRERFLWCNGGVSFPGQCPSGMEFDEKDGLCDFPRASTTTVRPLPTRPTIGPLPTRPTTRAPPQTTTRGAPQPTTRVPPQTTTRGPPQPTTRAPPPQPTTRAPPPQPTTRGPAPPPPRPPPAGPTTRATPPAPRQPVPTRAPPAGK